MSAGLGATVLAVAWMVGSGTRAEDAEDVGFSLVGGVGIEYFLADNLAFGFEGKYLWTDPLETTVDGAAVAWDMSAAMFTFGLRVCYCELERRSRVTAAGSDLTRFHFGMRFGGSVLTDDRWASGVTWEPEAQAPFGTVNPFAGLSLGADFGRNWGVELVLGGGEWVPVVEGRGGLGEYATVTCLPMIRYRYPLGSGRWVPYATAGGGFGYHEFNDQRLPGNLAKVRETKGYSPAVAAGGGCEYFFARNVSVGAEARWHYTWGHTLQVNDGPVLEGNVSAVQFMLALRLYLLEFGADKT
jgi:opacity protein-like surface antigen